MDPQTRQMEHMLAALGKAHREGAFTREATPCPWRAAEPEVTGLTHRRFRWASVAVPLAAAAAIAVLFVGPSLWSPRAVHEVAEKNLANDPLAKPAEVPAAVEAVTTTPEDVDCDYNGDGRVDGRDIQALVNKLRDADGDPILEAEQLQRCLLGN